MKNYSISKPEITLETAQKNYENARGQLENIRRGGTEELKAIASQVSYWGGKVNEIKNQGGVVDTDKDNNEVIYNGFKSSFIDEDAYNWRRNTRDSSIPAYGSKNFFINRKNELATQIQRESAQLPQLTGVEESGYNLYKTNPDVMRYGTDEQKIAYNYYSTLDRKRNRLNALSAEYNAVLGILNANETKGVHLNKEGKVDTRSGISEAQREKNEYGVVQDFYKKDYSFSPISILPEARAGDEQARYERNMETEGKIVLADDKIKAYKYYDENKDNEYADGLFGRIGANFKSGTIGEKIAETGANSWEYATDDIEAAQVYQQLDKRLRENNKEAYKDNNAFDTFVSTLSNYAPQFINQKKAEIKGKIAGAALGYFMGNAGAGARIGGAAASSADMFRRIAGSQYVELLQNSDMSEEDIKIMATNTALIESALEFGLSYIADKLIFGGETVGKKLGAEKLEDGIISILKKGRMSNKGIQVAVNGIKFIGKQAIEGIGEGTEEFLQTGTEIVARKHAEKGETLSAVELLKETFDFSSYTKEDFAQMKSAGLAAFIISAGSTGTMKSAVSSYMDAVDVVKTEEFGKMIKQAKLSDEYIADAVTICLNSENAEVRGLARKIDNAMQNNQTVSDKDIGRLFKYSTLVEKHNPFEITGGYVEKELKLEQSKSGLVTVYSKDWALGPDSAPVKVIEGLAKLSNSRIVIEDLDPVEVIGEDGEKKLVDNMGYVQDGVIHINSANVKTRLGAMVTLHEVTHNIENSDLYGAYKKLAFDILYGGENTESYKEAYNTIAERYGDKASSKEDIDKELVANFTMTKLDEKVINRIVMQNRNVAVRMFNALKNAYNKVENFITGTEQDLSDIERALDIFDRALAERRETIDNSDLTPFVDEEGNVQFGEKGNGEKRYLLNENFVNDYDDWVANGRADRQSLNVGTTSSALQSIGVKDQKITWDTNKINASLKKHSYLTDDILKQVPEVLEKPIIVMQSKGFDSRITMFGEVYDSDGLPIMAVLELLPLKDKSGVVLDEIKVVSTHSRKNNNPNSVVQTQSIIDTSDILYVEPNIKRTNNWLTRTRLQLPFGVTNYGSIKRITYPNGNVNTNNMQKSQNDAQESNGKQHLLGAVIEEGATTEENSVLEYKSTAKSRTKLERYENEAVRKVADAMSVRLGTAREFLKPIIQEMSNEYMKTGKLSHDTIDRLFEEAYKNGRKVNDEAYKEYADLRNYLRNTKIYFDSESATDIPDFFKDIRRYMGRLSVSSTNGTSVDSIYQELNEMHPSLFPEDILSSSDRMLRIMEVSDSLRKEEVTLDAYYNTEETKGDLKHEFEKAVYAFKDNLYEVKHFNDSLEKAEVKPGVEIDADAMQSVYDELAKVQKQSDKVMNNLLLTKDENAILDDMLKGNRKALREDIPDRMNKDNILKAYEVKAPVRALQNIIEKHKKAVRNNRNDTAMKMIELSDFWKDKKNGIMYMRETQERNIYDIVGDKKQADKIIETYFTPVHEHEAQRTRFKHDYFDRVRKMDIDLRVRSGNKNTESEAIQFIGEVEGDIADLEAKAEKRKLTDDENDRLINLKGSLAEFKRNNPNLDYNKINSCIKEFHKIYDELFEEMNRVRIRNGYAPVEYRKNYFPHFLETGTDDITGKIAKALGINVDVTELPTDLAGRTENFKPGIAWVQHVKRRNTNVTKYDAVEGFQKYIEGVSDVIFHTDDIQNLRALERALRYKYSEKGVKDEIDALRDRTDITDDERETLLDEAGKRNITSLGNYVNNLTEYTNLLANKKSMHDRSPETMFGRKIYNLFNWANSRVASNMVVGNLSTAITNFIPLTQATAVVGDVNMMIGFNQTVKNFLYDDGLTERSSFLTNRFGQDKLISKSKVADALVTPMELVDELAAGTIWRARYHQNIKKGMSDADAIKDADKYAANLIADRSKGSLPTLFGVKNPIVKAFTAFQVETNNQLSHLFKDIPKEAGEKLALVLFKYFLGAYLFNDVYEKVVGRRPALDPLSWTNEFVGDLTGYQMPNSIDIIASLVKREKVDFSTTKFKNSQAIANLGKNIAEDIPFIGGMLGGGRIPISSALPDVGELNKLNDDISNKKKAEIIHKNTISGGLINILMPYAGSQLTKTMKGIKAFAEGGSYSLNNDGKEQLQYPMERDLLTGAQSAIFGKNATKGARNWVEEGFGSLTAEQTDLYQRIIEDKKTSRTDVYNAISNARKAESVKDGDKSRTETQVRHEIVSKAKGLSWKQKYMIEYSFMSDENKEKIKAMTNNGVSQDTAYRVLYEYADSKEVSKEAKYKKYYEMSDGGTSVVAEKWGYEPELSVIKREALAHDSKLTAEEKQTINTALFGESETEYDFSNVDNYYYSTLSKNQKKGYDQYIKLYGKNSMNARTFYYAIKVMNSTKDGNGSKKVAKVTRLRKAGFTLAQANRIYNILN